MPLPYREVYDRWQRSKSFGDPRDLTTFSTDLNDTTGTADFSAGIQPSWWTKASTAADVNVFEPIAKYSGLEAAGRGIGGLFGEKGAEIGEHVGRSLPRTLAQTAPLIAAEVLSGGAATPVVAGALATGGLFGAQTYAETGSPTAAAISGVTAAALPAVGRLGGAAGLKFLGPETESVLTKVKYPTGEQIVRQTLPKEAGKAFQFKAAKLAGSQAAMVGALESSSALQSHELGTPFEPFSPEFWAQQIPFSLLDIVQTGRAKIPTAGEAKIAPVFPKKTEYVPPKGEPEAEANLSDMLDRMTNIAKDQNLKPEDKSKAFQDTLKVVLTPDAPVTKPDDRVIIIGHPKQMDNGSVKLFGTTSKYYDLPTHGNVFINNPTSATQFVNPDGSITFITSRKNVSSNVKYPLGPMDFPALRQKGQAPLAPAGKVEGAVVAPETDILTLRQKFEKAVAGNKIMFETALKKEPTDPAQAVAYWNDALEKMVPAHLKPGYQSPFDSSETQIIQEAGVDPFGLTPPPTPVVEPTAPVAKSPWTDEQLGAAKGEPGYVPTVDLIAWAKEHPDFQVQVDRYKTDNAGATDIRPEEMHAVAMEEIAHRLAYEANYKAKTAPTEAAPVVTPTEPDTVTQVRTSTQKIETAHQAVDTAQQTLDLVPGSAADVSVTLEPQNSREGLIAEELQFRGNPAKLAPAYQSPDGKITLSGKPGQTHADVPELDKINDEWVVGFTDPEGNFHDRYEAELVTDRIRTKEALAKAQAEGASPTQAVETVRLQTQTPKIDENLQTVNIEQDNIRLVAERERLHEELLKLSAAAQGVEEPLINPETGQPITGETPAERAILREEANKRLKAAGLPVGRVGAAEGFPEKPQPVYGEPVRDENGKNFKTRALAEAFRDADPDLEGYVVRDTGKGEFNLAKQINKEVSIEGAPGSSLENVLPAESAEDIRDTIAREATETEVTTPLETGAQEAEVFTPDAESRPDVSFTDYLRQLEIASQNPVQLRNATGFEDLPATITAIRQFRTAITEVFSKGQEGIIAVNDALEKAGLPEFDSPNEMRETFRKMRSGMEEFSGKYRSLALDSQTPHDAELTAEIGIQHPTQGLANFLDWFIRNNPNSLLGDLAVGLRRFSDYAHVTVKNEEGRGFWWRHNLETKTPEINLPRLPSSREDALGDWGTGVLHEIAHDSIKDIGTRTDPAAIEFKAKLQRILKTLRDSPRIPAELRKSIKESLAEGWYDKGAEHYKTKYAETAPGRDHWLGIHYSLQNEQELVAGIFDSPELVRLMQETKMTKSPLTVLNFFANAFARMFGYTPNAENAFAQLLSSYDNYLSGTRNAKGYNGMSYIRDSLVAAGVHPQGMASRLNTVSDLYNTGDLSASVRGFEREMGEGILPATTVAGPLDENVKIAIAAGDATAVKDSTANLLAEQVPQHQELWLRMKQDLQIAKNLYDQAQKGNLYAELSLFQEGLKSWSSKLNAMKNELDRHNGAIERWNSIDSMANSNGMQRLWYNSLKGDKPPKPTEQTGNEDIAHQALNLAPKSPEYIASERRRLAVSGEKPLNWVDRNAKFASFTSEELPAFKPIYQHMLETQANSHRRMAEMEVVRNSDPNTKGWNKTVANANKRVAETPGLNQIVSDMLRRAQVMDKMQKPITFDDPEMQTAIRRASDSKNRKGRSDKDDVITAFNSEVARAKYRVDFVIPQHFDMTNRMLTSLSIIGREIGMPSSKAIELSEQLHTALKQLRDPAQVVQGTEGLKYVASQMKPENFMKVMAQTNGFIEDSMKHVTMLQKYPNYISEQRYGKYHLVMSKEGEPYREGFQTEKAALARSKELATDGWVLEDIVPKEQANIRGYLRAEDPVIASQRELDQQTLNRMESIIADLPSEQQDLLRPMVQRAAEYESSAAAFSPIPTQASPRRKFRAGRETIDMMANAAEETKRFVNWMRHRESRIGTAIHMLDPEMLANRPLKQYATQFVDNQLAADNPIARRLSEGAFYWYLAGNFGNDILESMQTLTTGMASVIRETGSVTDALKYVTGASKDVFKRYTTGKWASKDNEWFINWLSSRGSLGLPTWGDIFDPTTQNFFEVTGPASGAGKALDAVKHGLRGYKALFLRHNDMVGGLAGFKLGRDLGMGLEDAARYAEGVKNRGLYSAGKVQRPVGLWSIKEKAVPQLMSSLKTYVLGWFSQLSHNYKVGFQNAPGDYTPTQRVGAKKAFLYMLGAQATLAGGLGLPGVGQALALLKQTTGTDIKGWTRKNLASMFGEDQDDYGGYLTGLALHGLPAMTAPFDISGRQITDVPFTGVSSWKGFDMSNVLPVPFSMMSDFLYGLGQLAKGGDPHKAFPIALQGPVQLIHGGGDLRNSKGELLYNLSPTERVIKSLGLEPSRVAAAKETAATIKSMNDAAEARKTSSVDAVADLYRRGDPQGAQRRMAEIAQQNPSYDMASFARSVALSVEKRTFPMDWKREVNPALDIVGLSNDQPSREMERLMLRRGVASDLGLRQMPSLRQNMRAASIDELMNSDPYTTRAQALQRLSTTRQLRNRRISLTPLESQSPYQEADYQ